MADSFGMTYLPFKSTPDLMQRFVRPALFSTGDAVFELRISAKETVGTPNVSDDGSAAAERASLPV